MIRLALDRPVELTNQETLPALATVAAGCEGRRLSSHRLEEAERQVEAEFAARKARVIAQEKLISMTRTRPWTKSPAAGQGLRRAPLIGRPDKYLERMNPIYPSPTRCSRALR